MIFLIIARPCPTCANASPRWAMARSSCRRCWDGSRRRKLGITQGKSRGKSHENPPNHPRVPWEKLLEVISRWFLGWFWWIFMGFRWVSRRKNDWRLGQTSDFSWDFDGFWMSFTQVHYQTDIDFEVTLTSKISCRGKYARTWLRCASTCTSTTWAAFSRRTGFFGCREGVPSWRRRCLPPGADII